MRMPAWPAVLVTVALAACQAEPSRGFDLGPALNDADAAKAAPGASAKDQGRLHFQNADYGLAERHFRKAVERNPNDTEAWLSLAASYDHLNRFDLAERAYRIVVEQAGYTAEIHNNLGYHYYLRGNHRQAEEHFQAAKEKQPDNPYVENNLRLLKASTGG